MKRKRRVLAVVAAGAVTIFFAAALTASPAAPYRYLSIFAKVLSSVEKMYVDDVDEDKMIFGAIRGMLRSLDPHSEFLEPGAMEMFDEDIKGKFGGVGIEIGEQKGTLTVIVPVKGSPADRLGVKPGDRIVAIEGKPTQEMSIEEVVGLMRGEPGTKVTATFVRRGSDEPFDLTFTREVIKIESAEADLLDGDLLWLKVRAFQQGTAADVERIFDRLSEQGKRVNGVVLDLRRNPGGLFDEAVSLADLFLDDGVIVSTRGRGEKVLERFEADRRTLADGAPVVAIIDGASASAAEIVAAALQDNRRSRIVGETSFGKGSVQRIVDLGGGFGLKLTVARYFTPKGRSIHGQGIKPDIEVKPCDKPASGAEAVDCQLEAALNLVRTETKSEAAGVKP